MFAFLLAIRLFYLLRKRFDAAGDLRKSYSGIFP